MFLNVSHVSPNTELKKLRISKSGVYTEIDLCSVIPLLTKTNIGLYETNLLAYVLSICKI